MSRVSGLYSQAKNLIRRDGHNSGEVASLLGAKQQDDS
jgi:hypothetical protein